MVILTAVSVAATQRQTKFQKHVDANSTLTNKQKKAAMYVIQTNMTPIKIFA